MIYDICIIGGGAAGLFAAVCAKQKDSRLNVVILERLDRVGKKLSITGNGRCNITNRFCDVSHYHGKKPQFILSAFSLFSKEDTERFFEDLGVPIIYEGDKGFPSSLQAASVTDALRFRCDELGIATMCGQQVTDIRKKDNIFSVLTAKESIKAHCVIAAGGMLSGGAKLGCDGSLYEILKRMGIAFADPSPAIVQLKTETDFVRQLKGIKVDAGVSLMRGKAEIKRESGEVLFCDYGLSGPPVLQISGHCKVGDTAMLDLMPDFDIDALTCKLKRRKENLIRRKNDEFLSGFMNKRLGQIVLKRAGISLGKGVLDLTDSDIYNTASLIKAFPLQITGNTGLCNSQVTKGGLLCDEFFPDTMMCKKMHGLFAAGEILDIDGDCGGFNLQWAWSSGFCAAEGAIKYLKGK